MYLQNRRRFRQLISAFVALLVSTAAVAHVKWFSPYDLLCPPRPLFHIFFSQYFQMFSLVMVAVMFATGYVDILLGQRAARLNSMIERITSFFKPTIFALIRFGVCAFLLALSYLGNVLLTPELQTDWVWVRWLQLLMAVLVVMPKTAYLTALGIVALYAVAASQYGWFHLLDYPIFLGVAAYLFLMSRYGDTKAQLAMTVLRVLTSITLLWAGMEKFAYPEWSFPMLKARPSVSMGFEPEFFMIAAGFVEFTAAFVVMTRSIAARVACAILLFIFTAAIPEFGLVDLIGHFLIIVVLLALILSHNPAARKFEVGKHNAVTAAAFGGFFFAALETQAGHFYGAHWLANRI